jgi:hypothetical protein
LFLIVMWRRAARARRRDAADPANTQASQGTSGAGAPRTREV